MLEIDYDIYKEEPLINLYRNKTVYIIHYPLGLKISYSNDIIKNIDMDNTKLEHLCAIEEGSSGAPILNVNNLKVFGIHIGKNQTKEVNIGIILKKAIDGFNGIINKNGNFIEKKESNKKIINIKKYDNEKNKNELLSIKIIILKI